MKLQEFIDRYNLLQKKHGLPGFEDMNLAFDIGKIKRDSGNLLRDIRRTMIEKIVYYVKLTEVMINPSQASPIFLMLLKEINSEDKKIIDLVMNSFVEIELASHKLDVSSNENDESKMINRIYSVWNERKNDIFSLVEILERNRKMSSAKVRSRDYFN